MEELLQQRRKRGKENCQRKTKPEGNEPDKTSDRGEGFCISICCVNGRITRSGHLDWRREKGHDQQQGYEEREVCKQGRTQPTPHDEVVDIIARIDDGHAEHEQGAGGGDLGAEEFFNFLHQGLAND